MGCELHGHAPDGVDWPRCNWTNASWYVVGLADKHFRPGPETHEFDGPDDNPTYQNGIPGEAIGSALADCPANYEALSPDAARAVSKKEFALARRFLEECVAVGCNWISVSY